MLARIRPIHASSDKGMAHANPLRMPDADSTRLSCAVPGDWRCSIRGVPLPQTIDRSRVIDGAWMATPSAASHLGAFLVDPSAAITLGGCPSATPSKRSGFALDGLEEPARQGHQRRRPHPAFAFRLYEEGPRVKSWLVVQDQPLDDGCTARELNHSEQWMLETVARILGHEVHDVEVGT